MANVTVAGNYLGTDAAGTADLGNGYGVRLNGSSVTGNTVGGTTAADRNVISGNGTGVETSAAGANNSVLGNYIGVAKDGASSLGNEYQGINVVDTSSLTIGGSNSSSANVISGNLANGVSFNVDDGTVTNNTVAGNFIGTDYNGTADLGNDDHGVYIGAGVTHITVGGATSASRNIISGNNQTGVNVQAGSLNTISNNYIGTNASGAAAIGNGAEGVILQADENQVTNNLISGNVTVGVNIQFEASNNTVAGNYIGTNAAGTAAIANGSHGVSLNHAASSNTIGGTTTESRNIISGNGSKGVNTEDTGTDNNTILGNYIGTNAAGTAAIANNIGIGIAGGSGNIIGGTASGSRNVVSGNTSTGIALADSATVQGNYVGLNAAGDGVIANATSGSNIGIISGSNNIIGGTSAAARNVIAGPSRAQIQVLGGTAFGGGPSTNNTIQGNYIGTNANGQVEAGFGSTQNAVIFVFDAQDNLVGGAGAGEGNVIAGNSAGVGISNFASFEALNNSILGNSIHDNTGGTAPSNLGIDLLGSTTNGTTFTDAGVTLNDAGDPDELSNHLMNFPVIQSVTSANGQATITYNLDINDAEAGATGYRVEFFANDSADPSGYGQGQTYLGSDTVSGDVTGRQVTITLPSGVSGTKHLSATTTMTDDSTNGFGHTSEFSADVEASLIPAVTPTPSDNSGSIAGTGANRNVLIAGAIIAIAIGLVGGGYTTIRKYKKR